MHSLHTRLLQDGWHVDALDTGRTADYLMPEAKAVILAINALRSDPAAFARRYVREMASFYDGSLLTYPGEIPIGTVEGVAAVEALHDFLLTQPPVGLLTPSPGMSRAASDHARDLSFSGRTSHTGADGSDPFTRMNRYGIWSQTAAESIAYGSCDGLRIVLQLAVDDGVATRGHRTDLLNPDFTRCGVAVAPHPEFRHCCTIEYAAAYIEG
jgi:hypothetical protein